MLVVGDRRSSVGIVMGCRRASVGIVVGARRVRLSSAGVIAGVRCLAAAGFVGVRRLSARFLIGGVRGFLVVVLGCLRLGFLVKASRRLLVGFLPATVECFGVDLLLVGIRRLGSGFLVVHFGIVTFITEKVQCLSKLLLFVLVFATAGKTKSELFHEHIGKLRSKSSGQGGNTLDLHT